MDILLSIIIPARDEENNIEETIKGLIPHINRENTEIIVVNDHSEDNTVHIVKDIQGQYPFIDIVDNTGEPGFANTLKRGFEVARGKYVLPVMADSCDDPTTIPLMLKKAEEGYDLVCGARYIKGGKRVGGPLIQGFFSRFVGITLHLFTGIPTRDVANAFKMYRRDAVLSIDLKEKGFAISMEACVKFFVSGYNICDVPTVWYGRKKGKSKFKLSRTLPYMKLYLWTIWKRWTSQ
ncbi:MAG: glycosyltransferase family 2 protein [Candidatus Ratteibacteria bacterium]|nr:glycosyltransferase family 2 protein [Candidatus Ratteibacteria bacterium]